MKGLMLQLRYLGVIPQRGHRDYGFHIEDKENNIRLVILTIDDAVFRKRELTFQEAPDLCYQKLIGDLRTDAIGAQIPGRGTVTPSDIACYRDAHPLAKLRARAAAGHPL